MSTSVPPAAKRFSLGSVLTDRHAPGHGEASRHIIYEWEDQIAAMMGVPLEDAAPLHLANGSAHAVARQLLRVPGVSVAMRAWDSWRAPTAKSLYFALSPQRMGHFSTTARAVPAIVDFWKTVDLKYFFRSYGNCPAVLISSKEAFSYLKENACPLELHHFPLSLPDRYKMQPTDAFEKTLDVAIAGRANKTLLEYIRRYEKDHPNVEYLFQEERPARDGQLNYISNKRGKIAGLEGRASYVGLLRSAKVAFYATPGIDGGEARTGGFNPVTPRLFEILAAGCHVVARYPDNDDTRFYGLQEICPSADTYDQFAATLDRALGAPAPLARNSAYLQRHYTSTRVDLLRQILQRFS
jgi:hypothetical protein